MANPGNITIINEYSNKDTIEACQRIIEKVRAGECFGMIFALHEGEDGGGFIYHGIGATGAYRDDPVAGRAVAGSLFGYFDKLSHERTKPGKL